MRQKKLVIGLLVMLALVVSSFTYAYWSSVDLNDTATGASVTIGEGRTATVTAALTASGSGTLVPTGEVGNSVSSSPVTSLVYTFTVDWDDNAYTGLGGTVAISAGNVSNATAAGLLNFAFSPVSGSAITEGTQLEVTVTVTLTAPANVTDYNAIINDAVTFDITFTVTPNA
ncbi:MAG: hypothetical protein K9L02_02675 [Acholeplasmataceae bacterium]|nr:hypothetical protein [Acholeplasmataceae bacterium]